LTTSGAEVVEVVERGVDVGDECAGEGVVGVVGREGGCLGELVVGRLGRGDGRGDMVAGAAAFRASAAMGAVPGPALQVGDGVGDCVKNRLRKSYPRAMEGRAKAGHLWRA